MAHENSQFHDRGWLTIGTAFQALAQKEQIADCSSARVSVTYSLYGKERAMVRKTKSAGSKVKITTANLAAAKATSSIKVAKALGKPVPHVQWDMPAGFR